MSIRNNINYEILPAGVNLSGGAFNTYNPNAGLNYSYGPDYDVISVTDLSYDYLDAPDTPTITLNASLGSFSAGTYVLGIRYISLDQANQIEAISQLTETNIVVSANDLVEVIAPLDAEHPFTHYQVTIRTLLSSTAYIQTPSANPITENFQVSSYDTSGGTITTLPNYGNVYKLSSTSRPFISDDIGNFILIENNHFGFRSLASASLDLTPVIEVCKTTNDPVAAWFDITGSTKQVKKISVALFSVGSPSGDLFIELRSNNSGVPSNTVLGFGGINANTLTSSPTWVDINVNVFCSPGRYWIVVYLDNSPDLSNYVKIARKSGNFGINNQHLYTYNSGTSTWTSANDGKGVAIDASWNSEDWWTDGHSTNYINNNGNLRFEILNLKNTNEAVIFNPNAYIAEVGSTSGIGHIGGAESSLERIIETADLQEIQGDVYIKNDTYTIENPLILTNTHLHGYEVTHDDYSSVRAIIKVDPLASPTPFSYANDGAIHITGDHIQITSIEIDGSDVAEKLIQIDDSNVYMTDCYLHNSINNGIVIDGSTNCVVVVDSTYFGNITDSASNASGILLNTGTSLDVSHCFFENITGSGIYTTGVSFSAQYCIFNNINGSTSYKGMALRIENAPSVHAHYCTYHDIQRTGIFISGDGHFFLTNNIFSTCGDYAVTIDPILPNSFGLQRIDTNGFYNNSPGNVLNNTTTGSGSRAISIAANPFSNSATSDFRLNSAISAGYNLIGTAYPQKFPNTNMPQKMDIGAVQTYGNSPIPRRNPTISFM